MNQRWVGYVERSEGVPSCDQSIFRVRLQYGCEPRRGSGRAPEALRPTAHCNRTPKMLWKIRRANHRHAGASLVDALHRRTESSSMMDDAA